MFGDQWAEGQGDEPGGFPGPVFDESEAYGYGVFHPETYLDRMERAEWRRDDKMRLAHNKGASRSETGTNEGNERMSEQDPDKVSSLDELSEIIGLDQDEDIVNMLVYGDAGSGKTVLAGSAKRVLFLAPEDSGTLSAKRQGSKARKWKVNNFDDLVNALNKISANIDLIKDNFDWLAIDSITHMQRQTMRQVLDDAVADDPDRDPDLPQMQDWQKYQNMFLRVVQAYNDLPINIIWTALARTEKDEEGDPILVPDIQGKGYQMAMTVASYMTSYGYLKTEEVAIKKDGEYVKDEDGNRIVRTKRTITWRDTGKIRGKDRTNALSPETVNLSLEDMTALINGESREDLIARKRAAAKAKREAAKKVEDDPKDETPEEKPEKTEEASQPSEDAEDRPTADAQA